ncbi:arabinan endo-1,5-alpha-L-arabinosidase [Aliifodinibius sp. S!AR15-10]|uniref:arabinan endo-1,5-alpha-L-arabinosidase n=1 Tax=Aliifodinibius sp. S!AR15-10 TaxID=2950437 RepID=UPI0028644E89|nr:arabinan endo-1,5-alpha-L-arabinosidase [Aliifodinibius sp. S!AR15-10]MDR8392943.1 arabinan endo-1,5-alpha-L-arabinosidase [Aliifodinibius sp. S!AR15-10]
MINNRDYVSTGSVKKTFLAYCFVGLILIATGGDAEAQNKKISVHDPVMIKQDQTYYLFETGRGISVWSSTDMQNWTEQEQIFDSAPEWTYEVNPEFRNHMWAPDITHHDGTYYLYYSVSSFGRNASAIGVATNTTLHPDDPDFEWVDHGPVVESVPGRDLWNAIDPNLTIDDEGTPWLTFGSYWLGMKLVKLQDNLTHVAVDTAAEWHTIAARHRYWKLDERDAGDTENGDIEAPFIFKKNGYYYLFSSWDRCCANEKSTYKVVVGRSKDITGPYLDRAGKDMRHGGGTLVIRGNEDWAGIGHNSAYTFDGTDYLVAHGYDLSDEGRSKLIMLEIEWDEGDWPQVSLD